MADLTKLKKGFELDFPVLHDPENGVVKQWAILNEKSGKIPHPTAVILDAEGVIRYLRVDTEYKVRPSPEELLGVLADLNREASPEAP